MQCQIYHSGAQYNLFNSIFDEYDKIPSRKIKDIIKDINVPDGQYLYVSINKSGYKILDKNDHYKRKKFFISRDWIDRHKTKIEEIAQNYKKNMSNDGPVEPCYMDHCYLSKVKQDQISPPTPQYYIYLVTGPITSAIKVGIWSNNLYKLASRYKCVYGEEIALIVFDGSSIQEMKTVENEFMIEFKQYRISGELFDKKLDQSYKDFLVQKTRKNGILWDGRKILLEKKQSNTIQLTTLPQCIELEEKNKFSFDGVNYSLTIRGTGYCESTFFKASDVGNICRINRIRYITKYKRGVDYVFFKNTDAYGNKDNKSNNNVSLYLTTCGIYKLLGRLHDRSEIHNALTLWISNNVIKKHV